MNCRYCELMFFNRDRAWLTVLGHEKPWQISLLCGACFDELEDGTHYNDCLITIGGK